jgi:Leucine-rich repeat (LRR) protein
MSDVEPFVQLRDSLEELCLWGSEGDFCDPSAILCRFPESFLALTKLQSLALCQQLGIEAIPAGISNLRKLKELFVVGCDLGSLPKELGALSQLEVLDVGENKALGTAPNDVAFPSKLKGLTSLRQLHLDECGLRRVPAFVRVLSSLEDILLFDNEHLQIDAPLDYLIECYPRLCVVKMKKKRGRWTPTSQAHLEAFKAKLLKKNPSAEVEF